MTLPKFSNYFKVFRLFLFFGLGLFIGGLLLLVVFFLAVFWIKKEYSQKVYPGVYLFSEDIKGKSEEELREFLADKDEKIKMQKIIFLWRNYTEKHWEIIPQMIDFSLDRETMIKEAFLEGRGKKGGESFFEIYRLLTRSRNLEVKFDYDRGKLEEIVKQIGSEVDRPAQDALFEFKEGKVINFQVSKEGLVVDRAETKSLILLAFTRVSDNKTSLALPLPIKTLLPRVATSQSNRLGIKEALGEGESFFKDSIPSRVHNIILASSYLHGVVISPNEIFSFAKKIGDISEEKGYEKAYVIKDKKTILEDGGGVCQVSTTLFRAALNTGLPIIERQPHYYRVGFYEQGGYPPGLDATVYPPSPDLKFKNDTPAYILIQTNIDKGKKRLAFQIYGTSDGRKVEMTKPVVHSQTPPPEPLYVDEPTLPVGVVKRIDVAHWGAKVSFSRKIYFADNNLKEEKTFWSNYTAWPAVYQRGTRQ